MTPDHSPRVESFLQYVGSPGYPCPLGAQLARGGDLPVTELIAGEDRQERTAKIRQSVELLIRRRISVLLYPSDPLSQVDLAGEHAHVYPDVFTEIMMRDLERQRDAGQLQLPKVQGGRHSRREIAARIDAAYHSHMPPLSTAVEMAAAFGVNLSADLRDSEPGMYGAVAELITIDPNVFPAYNADPVQSIVIGPAYPGARGESAAQRPVHEQADHGRRCVVTGLVMNFLSDVQAALRSPAGRAARQWLDQMPTEHAYNATHVLVGLARPRTQVVHIPVPPPAFSLPIGLIAKSVPFRAGRNDACPCGSGRKFKHCHGRR